MLKKIILMLSCCFFFQNNMLRTEDEAIKLLFAGTVLGTGIYWGCCRETNETKIKRVEKLCQYFHTTNVPLMLSSIRTCKDIQYFLSQPMSVKKELLMLDEMVQRSYQEMEARYGSWLKPWNWGSDMKYAYEKIKDVRQHMRLIMIMFRYQPLIMELSSMVYEDILVKKANMISQGNSSYPMISCAQMLRSDIQFVYGMRFGPELNVILIEVMEQCLALILGSGAYVAEKRIKDEIELQKRVAAAEEAKARAQQQQAWAQQQQVWNQSERNDIEREKVRKM